MTTMQLRAPHFTQLRGLPIFTRLIASFWLVVESYAEAKEMARAASRRYPFAEG